MTEKSLSLTKVSAGKIVTLMTITGGKEMRMRLTDMGLKEGIKLKLLHSHRNGPCVILVENTRLVLGYGMARQIMVREGG